MGSFFFLLCGLHDDLDRISHLISNVMLVRNSKKERIAEKNIITVASKNNMYILKFLDVKSQALSNWF